MNLRTVSELLAGLLAWLGFLLSLPIFGWLLLGTGRRLRSVFQNDPTKHLRKGQVSTGRWLRRGGDDRSDGEV